MNSIYAVLIGLVEGVTEFLPISSTAHILIFEKLFSVQSSQIFVIALQLGAILAVAGLYIRETPAVFRDLPSLVIAFLPTAVIGFVAYPYIGSLHNSLIVIAGALVLGGIWMMALPIQHTDTANQRMSQISYKQSFILGLVQSFAIIPGVSRSGSIFIAGSYMNINRRDLVRFSFLLGAITIAAATTFSIIKNPLSAENLFSLSFLLSTVTAAISAYLSCKWLMDFMSKPKSLYYFGWYRIVLGIVIALFTIA
jgi:undecaprenyl-diphosphatase